MEKYEIVYEKRLCKKCNHLITTTTPNFNIDLLYYGTIFFFTAAKEVAAILGKDTKLQEFAEIIKMYPNKQMKDRYQISVLHHAWEYFADKSQKGYPFYIWGMFPTCPNCGNKDTTVMDLIEVQIEEIESQPILYTQWDLNSYNEKQRILHAFFDEYLENIRKKYRNPKL
jgi:hypothetical protein